MSNTETAPFIFILGIQRSGTTWAANIFDASPDTLLFMEPFAPSFGLFPGFPETSFFLNSAPPEITRQLREDMHRQLYRRKFLFSSRSLRDPRYFRVERGVARMLESFSNYIPQTISHRGSQFGLLNLNRMERSYPIYPKFGTPQHRVVKELRFAGKIPLLLDAFPSARYLVVVRNPHATVHSMLNWFAQDRLSELRSELNSFIEKLEVQSIGSEYKKLIAAIGRDDLARRAALYWRVSYETMVRKLDGNTAFRLLPYEALASQPTSIATDLFEWAGIPWAPSVTEYITYSSGENPKEPGAINTVRRSASYYLSWRDKICKEVIQAVDEMVTDSFLMENFRPFYEPDIAR